jgi:lysophospholipase L1-like esterase
MKKQIFLPVIGSGEQDRPLKNSVGVDTSMTWVGKKTPSDFGDGQAWFSDVGLSGELGLSDGSNWYITDIYGTVLPSAGIPVLNTSPTPTVEVSGTLTSHASTATSISGYGALYKADKDTKISHIRIRRLAQTTAVNSDFWQTITVNVRSAKNGTLYASGQFSCTPYATSYNDVTVELRIGGSPITLYYDTLGDKYWIEYVAINRDGGRAPLGFSNTTVPHPDQLLPGTGENSAYQRKSDAAWVLTGGSHTYYFAVEPCFYSIKAIVPARSNISNDLPLVNIYAVVGRECNVYFDGLCKDNYKNYEWGVSSSIGTLQNNRLTVTPVAAATTALTISVKDRATGATIASSAVSILSAAAAAAKTKTILLIGDSTTANGEVVTELNVLDAADANTSFTFIGTKGAGANLHEGVAGWTTTSATTAGSPFFVGGIIDFTAYMAANGYASVDLVIINLGINDVFSSTTDAGAETASDTAVNNLGKLVTSIQKFNSNCHVAIALTSPPCYNQDGYGKNYGATSTLARNKRNIIILYNRLIAAFNGKTASKLWLLPYNVSLDTENNMIVETVAVNSRNATTTVKQANGVHPAATGYLQIADAAFAFIKNLP